MMRLGVVVVLLGSLCLSACATRPQQMYQAFGFGNFGFGRVTGVEITYGAIILPRGTAHRDYGPVQDILVQETEYAPVPESSEIKWTSFDGQHHAVTAPMRSFIQHPECFNGFEFHFVDDQVEIYLESRIKECRRFQGAKLIKVFPP